MASEANKLERQSTDEAEEANLSTRTIRANTPMNVSDTGKNGATTPVALVPLPPPSSPSAESKLQAFYRFERPRSVRHPDKGKRLPHMKNVGIVIGDFKGMLPDELSLRVGERIEIISKDTRMSRNIGWWTGRNSKGKIGICPAQCVKVVTNLSEANTIPVQSEYPLEIPCNEVKLKEVIGVGGFGKVYRALYKGEEVAVKVAKTTTFDLLKAVQEVISEAEKFAHLAHSNVCALVGVVLVKDVCLVMEYARGGALSEVLHKKAMSLPIDVILDWATQIASGMNYLHHEATPSLIHRDLKSSNILLANKLDPNNLRGNTMKITDFGLAREIEHTTFMSGAGTYPWMAPEVIRSSDFSKKSDVWSYAVVLWELLTGERPYGGLNLFVVAYGVGHGTLSLPIPEGCPEDLGDLMRACWEREYPNRPSFTRIIEILKEVEGSAFFSMTSDEVFRSIQSSWKEEIQQVFTELKKKEADLRAREDELHRRLKEKEKVLNMKEEEYQKKVDLLDQQATELNWQIEQLRELQSKERPPRLKRFKLKELWRRLFSVKGHEHVLPSRTNTHGSRRSDTLDLQRERRFGTSSYHRRQSSDGASKVSMKEQLNPVSGSHRRGSAGTSPSPPEDASQTRLPIGSMLALGQTRRQRSCSDLQSQQQAYPSHVTSTPPQIRAVSTTVLHPAPVSSKRPGPLSLRPKANSRSSYDNSPSSPNVTVTPAEEYSRQLMQQQYDSGNSTDTSGYSELIKLDSPVAPPRVHDEFDPLRENSFCSIDSLLYDPAGNTSPKILSTSPLGKVSTSPRQQRSPRHSLVVETSPSIVRPRPRGLSVPATDAPLPISAPSSRPHSPNFLPRSNSSPTGSVHSLIVLSNCYDSDGGAWGGFQSDIQSDSDASLLDLRDSYQDTDGRPPLIPDLPLFNPDPALQLAWFQQYGMQPQ